MKRKFIKGVLYEVMSDKLDKSLVDDLSYNSDIKIEKSGVDIKEKIKQDLVKKIMCRDALLISIEILATQIGVVPGDEIDEYQTKGLRDKLSSPPRRYSWDQIRSTSIKSDKQPIVYGSINSESESKSISDENPFMVKYNEKVYKFIESSVDCFLLKTIIDNIIDTKTYSLNIQLATKLGF